MAKVSTQPSLPEIPEVPPVYSRFRRPPQVSLACEPGSSLTQQHFKAECDINEIYARFVKTGEISPLQKQQRAAMYADVSEVGDLQASFQKVEAAREGFETLPAKVRERFQNSPIQLLAFLSDVSNRAEAVSLGLVGGEAPVSSVPPVSASPGPAKPGSAPST